MDMKLSVAKMFWFLFRLVFVLFCIMNNDYPEKKLRNSSLALKSEMLVEEYYE